MSSRLGLGSSFGIQSPDMEYAFERGINYFYWGSIRRPGFGRAVAGLAPTHRDQMIVVVQSYTRVAALMRRSLEGALRKLKIDYADFLLLGWWNAEPPGRIMDAARRLRDAGKVRHLMISSHNRPAFERFARDPDLAALMVRYNASHPGAEQDVFPLLGDRPPAIVSYTATRWGELIDPKLTPDGEATPDAADCYRFALTNANVDVCIAGPKNRAQLDQALQALDRGSMDPEELAWMKRVGAAVKTRGRPNSSAVGFADRLMGAKTD